MWEAARCDGCVLRGVKYIFVNYFFYDTITLYGADRKRGGVMPPLFAYKNIQNIYLGLFGLWGLGVGAVVVYYVA